MMANQIDDKPSLPSYIVRCEYLESTGTQYIDLGYPLGYNNKVVVEALSTYTGSSDNYLLGNSVVAGQRLCLNLRNANGRQHFDGIYIDVNLYRENKSFYTISKEGIYCNEDFYNFKNTKEFVTEGNVYLSGSKLSYGGVGFKGKIYSCQIYENDVLVHDYIPAFNVNVSRAGMYDLVTGIFLTNNGKGEFSYG
jgi:hypothetical protein